MSFSLSYSNQNTSVGKCKVCGEEVNRGDDMTVDRITIHKTCFICPICKAKCYVGSCSRDQGIEGRYGLYWYCGEHMLLPPGQKTAKLQELGMGKGHKKVAHNGQPAGAEEAAKKKAEKAAELQAKLKEAEEQRKKYEQMCKDLEAQLKAL